MDDGSVFRATAPIAWFSSASVKNRWCRRAAKYPALHQENCIFDLGFVSRFVGSRWHDRDAVVLRHLVIGTIEIRLIAAGAVDAGPWVIRDD